MANSIAQANPSDSFRIRFYPETGQVELEGSQPLQRVSQSRNTNGQSFENSIFPINIQVTEILVSGTDDSELRELIDNAISTRVGETTSIESLKSDINKIRATGYFKEVSIQYRRINDEGLQIEVDVIPIFLSAFLLKGKEEFTVTGKSFLESLLREEIGEELTPSKLKSWEEQVNQFYYEDGYLQLIADWSFQRQTGELTFFVKEGIVQSESITLRGVNQDGSQTEVITLNSSEREFDEIILSYIKRVRTSQLGETLDRQRIETNVSRIKSLNIFDNVKYIVTPIYIDDNEIPDSQTVEITIEVEVPLEPAQRFGKIGQNLVSLDAQNLLIDAEKLLSRSRELFYEASNSVKEFIVVNSLCDLYLDDVFYTEEVSQYIKAVEACHRSTELSLNLGSLLMETISLGRLAKSYRLLGDSDEATLYYKKALLLASSIDLENPDVKKLFGDFPGAENIQLSQSSLLFFQYLISLTLFDSGENNTVVGNYQQALYLHNQSIGYSQYIKSLQSSSSSSPSHDADSDVLSSFFEFFGSGLSYSGISEIYKALFEKEVSQRYERIFFDSWINYFNSIFLAEDSSSYLGGSGISQTEIGLQSIPYRLEASSLGIKTEEFNQELKILMISLFSSDLLDKRKTLQLYDRLIGWLEHANQSGDLAFFLYGKAEIHFELGEYAAALEAYSQSNRILQVSPSSTQEILNYFGLGKVYRELGDKKNAISAFNNAQKVSSQASSLAATYDELGKTYQKFGDYDAALNSYSHSLRIWRVLNNSLKISEVLHSIAISHQEKEEFQMAKQFMEMSLAELELGGVEKAESIESQLKGYSIQVYKTYKELSSYFQSKREYYDSYIQLLVQNAEKTSNATLGKKAFEVSEQARARTLQLFLGRAKVRTSNQGEVSTDLTAETFQQIQPLSLQEIQHQVLTDNQTVLLEYALGNEQSHLWIVTSNQFQHYLLPGRAEIEIKAREFYRYLTVPDQRVRPRNGTQAGEALVEAILPPEAMAQLEDKTRLLVVGDGVLQYIPFHALPNPDPITLPSRQGNTWADHMEPMLIEYEVIGLPSASALAVVRQNQQNQPQPTREVAVFADPVFGHKDSRFQGDLSDVTLVQGLRLIPKGVNIKTDFEPEQLFSRLPGTEDEAKFILTSANDPMSSQWLGFEATREKALGDLSQYRIVHFATHGLLDVKKPERSGVMLSVFDQTGVLQQNLISTVDTFNMQLNADLVVLSGCRTGLDADLNVEDIRGEGLFSMTGGLMFSGAERVLSSVWSVQSDATNTLMERFYNNVYNDKVPMTISQALRQAQISMWHDPRWQSPYYWAAFTLQGEWR